MVRGGEEGSLGMGRVRIVSGQYGGRVLDAPDNRRTHPMSERIRGAIFNSLGDLPQGAEVLDAFAGSGAVGLEALSRGAAWVTFVEKDRLAANILRKNVVSLGVNEQTTVTQSPLASWSDTNAEAQFDLIFADPPYHDVQFSTVEKLFLHLKPGALMVLSHPGRGEAPTGAKGIVVVDNRSYGTASLTFFRRES